MLLSLKRKKQRNFPKLVILSGIYSLFSPLSFNFNLILYFLRKKPLGRLPFASANIATREVSVFVFFTRREREIFLLL